MTNETNTQEEYTLSLADLETIYGQPIITSNGQTRYLEILHTRDAYGLKILGRPAAGYFNLIVLVVDSPATLDTLYTSESVEDNQIGWYSWVLIPKKSIQNWKQRAIKEVKLRVLLSLSGQKAPRIEISSNQPESRWKRFLYSLKVRWPF